MSTNQILNDVITTEQIANLSLSSSGIVTEDISTYKKRLKKQKRDQNLDFQIKSTSSRRDLFRQKGIYLLGT